MMNNVEPLAMNPKTLQRYAIIGAGALGGLYGAMLARGGHDVHFLLKSDYEHVRKHGLKVDSIWGDFELPRVNAHATAATLPPCDVTIVALKTTQNHQLPELLATPTSQGGSVLVLQNGLDIETEAIAATSRDRVMSGCCFLCSNKVGPGHIRHLDQGRIVFGDLDQNVTHSRAQQTAAEMVACGIDAKVSEHVVLVRWRKLMWNIPFNGLSVILDASTKELIDDPAGLHLATCLVDEVHRAASALGIVIPEDHKLQTIESTRKMVPYDSSMRLDFKSRRPMEIHAIFDNPVRSAATVGFEMPLVSALRDQLRFLDRRNGNG
jgi:2-dehydropantoate 2-reductase